MISSMTGFGRAVVSSGQERFIAEARSVNNRYTESRIYGLHEDFSLEFELNKRIKQMFHRGKFDVVLKKEIIRDQSGAFEEKKLQDHFQNLQKIQKKLKLNTALTLETVLSTFSMKPKANEEDSQREHQHFMKAATGALEALRVSREKEGKVLFQDMKSRLQQIAKWFDGIEKVLPSLKEQRRSEVNAKIATAIQDLPLDSKRVEAEIALMIEKMDVTEELVRFKKHLQSFQNLLSGRSKESVGRELDFTIQEMNREINTLGAKISNAELSKVVVNIKSEMEKIREQVQNIE